jgi:uncharacterized membrane protein
MYCTSCGSELPHHVADCPLLAGQPQQAAHRYVESNAQAANTSKTWALVAYILQGLGFFIGITWIVAIVISYIARGDSRGTWVESHCRWQIRTFWYSLLWGLPIVILAVTIYGLVLAIPFGVVLFVWLVYRVAKGLIRLSQDRLMYV